MGNGAGMGDTIKRKPRRVFTPLRIVGFWVIALALYFLTPLYKAVGWLALDVPILNGYVDRHMRDVHTNVPFACLYTLTCASGEARLEIQIELTPEELYFIKQQIWRRRFEDYCPGPTANIGLEHGVTGNLDKWRFGYGFGGATGLAAGDAFAPAGTWTPCTRDKAYWTREDGIVAHRARP